MAMEGTEGGAEWRGKAAQKETPCQLGSQAQDRGRGDRACCLYLAQVFSGYKGSPLSLLGNSYITGS